MHKQLMTGETNSYAFTWISAQRITLWSPHQLVLSTSLYQTICVMFADWEQFSVNEWSRFACEGIVAFRRLINKFLRSTKTKQTSEMINSGLSVYSIACLSPWTMAREVQQSYLHSNYDESLYWTAVPLTLTASTRNCELEMKYS